MEEFFELAAVIIIAVIGIVTKAAKGKKKKEARSASAWDELGAKIGSGIDKVIEIMEEDDDDRIKINIPSVTPKPGVVSVEAAQPVVVPSMVTVVNEGTRSTEGDCDHPLHMPVPAAAIKSVEEAPELQLEKIAVHRSGVFPDRVTAAQLRQAVVMNEVLGRPVSLKGAARR